MRKGKVIFFSLINATDAIEITGPLLSIEMKGKKMNCEQLLTCKFIDIQ